MCVKFLVLSWFASSGKIVQSEVSLLCISLQLTFYRCGLWLTKKVIGEGKRTRNSHPLTQSGDSRCDQAFLPWHFPSPCKPLTPSTMKNQRLSQETLCPTLTWQDVKTTLPLNSHTQGMLLCQLVFSDQRQSLVVANSGHKRGSRSIFQSTPLFTM